MPQDVPLRKRLTRSSRRTVSQKREKLEDASLAVNERMSENIWITVFAMNDIRHSTLFGL